MVFVYLGQSLVTSFVLSGIAEFVTPLPYDHLLVFDHLVGYDHLLGFDNPVGFDHPLVFDHLVGYDRFLEFDHLLGFDCLVGSTTSSDPATYPFDHLAKVQREREYLFITFIPRLSGKSL